MSKKSNSNPEAQDFSKRLKALVAAGALEEKYVAIFQAFHLNYQDAVLSSTHSSAKVVSKIFNTFLDCLENLHANPPEFDNYHKKIRSPFDYYQFGIDFMEPLVDKELSTVQGLENVELMKKRIDKGENVILFGNHQTESDPQLTSILLENSFPEFAEKIIFVAGERVITDPLAIPFSLGCDLLCIYSKKYIDHYPNLRRERLLHNQKTMKTMQSLLKSGGRVIYVAPSGGRDRANSKGEVEVAKFDAASIEMFYLMAKKAKTPTHFHPYTLATYEVLPPPDGTQRELGEDRKTKHCPIHADFGPEIDMQHFPGCDIKNKLRNREKRAEYIWGLVKKTYASLIQPS